MPPKHTAAVRTLLTLAAGGAQSRVADAVRRYRDDPNAQLLVAVVANHAVGLVGYEVGPDAAEVALLHVATAAHVRGCGVGRWLLAEVRQAAPPGLAVVAETDDEPFSSTAPRGSP